MSREKDEAALDAFIALLEREKNSDALIEALAWYAAGNPNCRGMSSYEKLMAAFKSLGKIPYVLKTGQIAITWIERAPNTLLQRAVSEETH